jgi:acyl-CoA reductase-like NAD-dependent aldehyde dehydrogenase
VTVVPDTVPDTSATEVDEVAGRAAAVAPVLGATSPRQRAEALVAAAEALTAAWPRPKPGSPGSG